jgi:hypothetical protein
MYIKGQILDGNTMLPLNNYLVSSLGVEDSTDINGNYFLAKEWLGLGHVPFSNNIRVKLFDNANLVLEHSVPCLGFVENDTLIQDFIYYP